MSGTATQTVRFDPPGAGLRGTLRVPGSRPCVRSNSVMNSQKTTGAPSVTK